MYKKTKLLDYPKSSSTANRLTRRDIELSTEESLSHHSDERMTLPDKASLSNKSQISQNKKRPLSMHEKKLMSRDRLTKNSRSDHSDSGSSSRCSSDEYSSGSEEEESTKRGTLVIEEGVLSENKSQVADPQVQVSRNIGSSIESTENNHAPENADLPFLSFHQIYHGDTPPYLFYCKDGFLLNASTKNPHGTKYHVSLNDVICVSSSVFRGCSCSLTIKSSKSDDIEFMSMLLKPSMTLRGLVYECEMTIPSSVSRAKSGTSSKVAYIEIRDDKKQAVATSSSFWVRSRTRLQITKDTSRKNADNLPIDSKKRKRQDDTTEGSCTSKDSGECDDYHTTNKSNSIHQDSTPIEYDCPMPRSLSPHFPSHLPSSYSLTAENSVLSQSTPKGRDPQCPTLRVPSEHSLTYHSRAPAWPLPGTRSEHAPYPVYNNPSMDYPHYPYQLPMREQLINYPPLPHSSQHYPSLTHHTDDTITFLYNEVLRLNSIVSEHKQEIDKLKQGDRIVQHSKQ